MKNLILILLLSFSAVAASSQTKSNITNPPVQNDPEAQHRKLIDEQLNAYNQRDLESFLMTYSDDVKIYNFPNTLSGAGKDYMTKVYGKFFNEAPNLHCEIVNRTALGNTIIDHEKVSGLMGGASMEAIAIYKIKNNKISEVYFIRK
ncbi:nuclear transport factor 2 family protein [Pedobacter sp. V48]|uniref:nuclear transport factor 2 family protein n=1 Tax=Pedobacter sp. V48 TaxID=509635 RepID=UPI00190F3058|nr:nuclear transport factor 2 family protein [Pedobacter sp. V48]